MPIPVAQYVRMSTEHQQYSLENQSAAIKRYADEHDFLIVQKYEDVAKSGLLLRNRAGLRMMLQDVVSRRAQFKAILVLDVTRWGRFQDIDESAHYEFLCKQAGAPVHYCSEGFSNDYTLASMIIKTLKRSMAAEYSRELSGKVAAGTRRIASLGFRNGGVAGYGFRRLLVSAERAPKQFLGAGERKSLSTDRVTLVPGPQDEVDCVREMYRMFIDERLSTAEIANELNRRGIPYSNGRQWYQVGVYRVLTHPKYCGCHVFGQRSQILKGPNVTMPRSTWCIVPDAFEPIVSRDVFEEAQRIIHSRTFFKTNDRVLDALRQAVGQGGQAFPEGDLRRKRSSFYRNLLEALRRPPEYVSPNWLFRSSSLAGHYSYSQEIGGSEGVPSSGDREDVSRGGVHRTKELETKIKARAQKQFADHRLPVPITSTERWLLAMGAGYSSDGILQALPSNSYERG